MFLLSGALLLVFCCFCSDPNPVGRGLPPRPINGVWHKVQSGETLVELALQFRVPGVDIEEINGLDRSEPLPVGRTIFIPGVKKKHPGGATARTPAKPSTTATDAGQGGTPVASSSKKGTLRFIWPVNGGKLSSRFGKRGKRAHEGIDIAAPEGTAVLAAADGTVIYAGSGLKGYGKLVIIRHKAGLVTVYAHNKRNLVREAVMVKQGQVIAEVGHTGRTTGNHLHFEVRQGEKPLDPQHHVRP